MKTIKGIPKKELLAILKSYIRNVDPERESDFYICHYIENNAECINRDVESFIYYWGKKLMPFKAIEWKHARCKELIFKDNKYRLSFVKKLIKELELC